MADTLFFVACILFVVMVVFFLLGNQVEIHEKDYEQDNDEYAYGHNVSNYHSDGEGEEL